MKALAFVRRAVEGWGRGTLAVVAILSATLAGLIYVRVGPLPDGILNLRDGEWSSGGGAPDWSSGGGAPDWSSTEVADRNGELLYEARAGDGSRSTWLPSNRLPQTLVDATIAAEDHRFFRHIGIDPIAVARAAARNLKNRRSLEGGSTITQQVAKLVLARTERGMRRSMRAKLREAVIALRLEHRLTKREILALYLNLAPYGNQLAGADRASRAYFGHDASLLTPAEAAFLASLPQRPTSYNPYRDPQRARRRQEGVIVRMGIDGMLDPAGVRAALDEKLALVREPAAFLAPHFVDRVLALDGDRHSRRIVTTLDASLQRAVAGIIRAARPSLERHGAHNVAAAVLDNATGEWLAWEGSGNYDDNLHGGKIDGVISPRQPGSALKPFTYALAFEDGESPATVLPDVPSYFPTAEDGVVYSPRNYDNRFRGPLLARAALAGSENVPAVALASRVGVPNLLRFLRLAGFSTFEKNAAYYGLGVTLGDAEVRLDEMIVAYAAFARGGSLLPPTLVRESGPRGPRQVVSARSAFWITDILADDGARAYAFGRGGSLEFPFAVAAKTGTSQAYHDNWTIGYTRDVTVGVWVGNFDRRTLIDSSGVTGAGPIFHAILLAAAGRAHGGAMPDPQARATAAIPERTSRRTVCALSGMRATPDCPAQIEEWTADESADRVGKTCTWHRRTSRGIVVDWPAEYRAWASAEHVLDAVVPAPRPRAIAEPALVRTSSVAPPSSRAERQEPVPSGLRVVSPPDGAVYLIDPTLRREFQTIGLRGVADPKTRIEWRVDGQVIGNADSDRLFDWPLVPGRHVISAYDASGRRADAAIVVK